MSTPSLFEPPERQLACEVCAEPVGAPGRYRAGTRALHTDCWDGKPSTSGFLLVMRREPAQREGR